MEYHEGYAARSLELHLFFARIMKEHALFLKAGFGPVDAACAKEAEHFKEQFEALLCHAVKLSAGVVSLGVLTSGEVVTEFTACAEKQTQQLTGIAINRQITAMESHLHHREQRCSGMALCQEVRRMNATALGLVDGLINLKEKVLHSVLCCKMFTANYPLLLEHIIREAKLYRSYLYNLETGMELGCDDMRKTERFWNQIMMEHAMFIRGLLDPSEDELMGTANGFAQDFSRLLCSCREAQDKAMGDTSSQSLAETIKFRDFKAAGAEGITQCKIRSIILPLLADHVLREANHYIRLLCD